MPAVAAPCDPACYHPAVPALFRRGVLLTEQIKFEKIGKYRILSKIGQGAMGEVFRAEDTVLHRQVAIKTMSTLLSADDDLVQRFRREAQSAAGLNHLNIVTVFDFGEEHGVFFLAMELLEGHDLKELMSAHSITDLSEKLEIMEQVCEGLAFAHARGVIHRDLKPANLRVLPSGRVKIMDFGLARMQASEMTRTGTVMGTPNYMSPEQVRGQRADARSDVFSLGAVFYELLTGHKAFQAESMHSILYKVLEDEPEPALNAVPDMPAALDVLIRKCLEKEPERRYQDAGQLKAAVRQVKDALASGRSDPTVSFSGGGGDAPESAPTMIGGDSLVTGATALDLSRVPAGRQAPRGPSTLSGRDPTHVSGRDPTQHGYVEEAEAPPPSRLPVVLGGAALAVVLGVAAVLVMRDRGPGATPPATQPPDLSREQEQILTEEVVKTQVELARLDLENKDYAGAIRQAERALQVDPRNAVARTLLEAAKGRVADLDSAATEARTAFARGDTEGAARALSRVMALDPRHPVAGELSAALNQQFRRQAEEARSAALQARTVAAGLKAEATDGWAPAMRANQEAEALLRDQQFAVATQRFLQSRDAYERAGRLAEVAARPPSVRPAVLPNPGATPRVAMGPGVSVGPGVTGVPPVSVPVATLPPPTLPAVTLPVAASQEPAVRKVIADYGRAIESKDLALFRAVKPNLTPEDEKRLAEAFKAIKSQQVGITVENVQVDGTQATVRVSRQDTINGKAVQRVPQTFRLAQVGGAWTIQSIGQ
jgi:serine/threonine-protein kinase